MNVASEIKAYVIKEYLRGTPPEELESSYDLLKNGVVDSLRLLQLISWVGQRFSIAVDDMDISPEDFRSIDAIEELVTRTKEVKK
jgi:methoxymalonate biosynthesis acyl carrier protein